MVVVIWLLSHRGRPENVETGISRSQISCVSLGIVTYKCAPFWLKCVEGAATISSWEDIHKEDQPYLLTVDLYTNARNEDISNTCVHETDSHMGKRNRL